MCLVLFHVLFENKHTQNTLHLLRVFVAFVFYINNSTIFSNNSICVCLFFFFISDIFKPSATQYNSKWYLSTKQELLLQHQFYVQQCVLVKMCTMKQMKVAQVNIFKSKNFCFTVIWFNCHRKNFQCSNASAVNTKEICCNFYANMNNKRKTQVDKI